MIERLFAIAPDESRAIEQAYKRRIRSANRVVSEAQQELESAKRKAKRAAKRTPQEPTPDDWETTLTITDWE